MLGVAHRPRDPPSPPPRPSRTASPVGGHYRSGRGDREWVPGDFASLGTDGWGMSDTRAALRRHFLVDAESIVVQSLATLAKRGEIGSDVVRQALAKYRLDDPRAATATSTAGSAWGEEG